MLIYFLCKSVFTNTFKTLSSSGKQLIQTWMFALEFYFKISYRKEARNEKILSYERYLI